MSQPTAYAIAQGAIVSDRGMNEGNGWWWLRSLGTESYAAVGIDCAGEVYTRGYIIDNETIGVRPALWIDYAS